MIKYNNSEEFGGSKKIEIAKLTNNENKSILDSKSIAILAVTAAIDQKGLDVRSLDMRSVSDIADYFIITSATSERHAKGIADKIMTKLSEAGERTICTDGYDKAEWILLDYGSVVIHIFFEPKRQYYCFDELWKSAREMELDPELAKQAKKFKTGISYISKDS